MPCQRVLAPVTGAGPPQAAKTAAAQVPPGWSRRDPGRHVMGLPVHAVTYGYQPRGGYLVVSAHNAE